MELLFLPAIILVLVLVITISDYITFTKVMHYMKTGTCDKCGANNSYDIYHHVGNQHYHDSRQDLLVSVYCRKCKSKDSSLNVSEHFYHNDENKEGYELALKLLHKDLPWMEGNDKRGREITNKLHDLRLEDKKEAIRKGIIKEDNIYY